MNFLELEWWAYLFIVFSFFVLCLGLNYMVKKFNEAKMDERFIRMIQKASTTQSTQVTGHLIVMETARSLQNQIRAAQPSPPGISLVFNQEENKRKKDLEDTFNIIKNSIPLKKSEPLSLNSNPSGEKIDGLSIKRSEGTNQFLPIKIVESGRIEPKETILNNVTNKVKFNEPVPSSIDQSGGNATEINHIKNIESESVTAERSLSVKHYDTDINKLVTVIELDNNPSSDIQSDNNISVDLTNKTNNSNVSERIEIENHSSCEQNNRKVTEKVSSIVTKINTPDITQKVSNVVSTIKISRDDIDADNVSVKKAMDNIVSNIANELQASINNQQKETFFAALKEMSSDTERVTESRRNVTVFSPIKLRESTRFAALANSTHDLKDRDLTEFNLATNCDSKGLAVKVTSNSQSDNDVAELDPLKTKESGSIYLSAKETFSHTESGREAAGSSFIIKSKSGRITAFEDVSEHEPQGTEQSPVSKIEFGHIAGNETISETRSVREITGSSIFRKYHSGAITTKETPSMRRDNTPTKSLIKNTEIENVVVIESSDTDDSERMSAEASSSQSRSVRDSLVSKTSISAKDSNVFKVIMKSNECIESDTFLQNKEDSSVLKMVRQAGTVKTAKDDPEKEKSLTDRIKALLVPPVLNEDTIIIKPNPNAKKK